MSYKSSTILTNFSYKVDFKVKPTYEISSTKSSTSKILSPIEYSASADMLMDEQEFVAKANTKQIQKLNTLLTQTFEKWAQEFEKELNDIDRQESDEGEK